MPSAASLQTGGAFATVLTTLNAGFFAQGSAVTNVPSDVKSDQIGRGVWIRGNAGLFDIKATATLNGIGGSSPIAARTTFAGVQAGVDLGNFDIAHSGFNVIYGVTGGEINVQGSATGVSGSADYKIPFGGAYLVASKGGFVAEFSYRHDFINAVLSDRSSAVFNTPVSSASNTGSVSMSYRYGLPSAYFVEPSVAFVYSRFSTDSFATALGPFQALPINSDLGRAGFRIGKDFSLYGFQIEPFFAASVWHEFANANTAALNFNTPNQFSGTVTRVGTFGQYSLGVSSVVAKSLLIFARGDIRSGSFLSGNAITGGMRYNF